METSNKPFDAVQMMRSIRDKLGKQISGMTFEEEQTYIRQRLRDESTDGISGAGLEDSVQTGRAVEGRECSDRRSRGACLDSE